MAMYPYPPYYPVNYGYYVPPVQPPLAYVLANHFGPYGNGPVSAAGEQFLSYVAPNLRPLPQPYMPQGMPYGYIPPPQPQPQQQPPPPRGPPRTPPAEPVPGVRCYYDYEKHCHCDPYYHECCGGRCTYRPPRHRAWRRHHGPGSV